MKRAARPFVVGASCVAALALLAGCGEDATGARTTLAEIQPSSYVVRDPVTTTTTQPGAQEGVGEDGISTIEQQYTVVSGDYPLRVANLFGVPVIDLCNYNGWTPPNCPEFPFPGTVILIPPGAKVPGAPATDTGTGAGTDTGTGTDTTAAPPTQTTLPPSGECTEGTYTLVSGDFPGKVAEQFDITVDQLNAANANTPGYSSFIVGTEIKIPCP
jgi:LysM repeat protein